MSKIFLTVSVLVISIISSAPITYCCTLDPSTSKIIDESIYTIRLINGNLTLLNTTLGTDTNYTHQIDSIYQLNLRVNALVNLIGYNIGYNNTNSVTIKQYTETYFPAITLTLLLLIFIISIINLVLHCKKFRKPITL